MKTATKTKAAAADARLKTAELAPEAPAPFPAYERYRELVREVCALLGTGGTALDDRWSKSYALGGYYDTVTVTTEFRLRPEGTGTYRFQTEVNWGALGAKSPADAMVFAATLQEAALLAARIDMATRAFELRYADRDDFFAAQAAHFAR